MENTIAEKPEDMPPHLCLDIDDLPELENMEPGKSYKLQITVTMKAKSTHDTDDDDDEGTVHGDFDITSVKSLGSTKKLYDKSLTNYGE